MIESLEPTSNPYPRIPNAIWATELYNRIKQPFCVLNRVVELNMTPFEAVQIYRLLTVSLLSETSYERLSLALSEMRDPSYITYIAGLMGAV